MDDYDVKAQQQENYPCQTAQGALMSAPGIDHAEMIRSQRIQSAIWNLTEARRIRNDPALMAEIKAWVAEKRAEFLALMDDLG